MYFPDVVEGDDSTYPIDFEVLNAPIMENGENYKVQQGAGMAVAKSDTEHEYASCVFLKWFTQKENNLRFVSDSGYMPVEKEANNIEALDEVIKANNIDINKKAYECLKKTMSDFNNTKFYTTKNFEKGYSARKVLDYNLSDRASKDKEALDNAVASGAVRSEELNKYITDDNFDQWYTEFCMALNKAAGK